MSGQESIKGYLFQSLIAVLKSLNSDWKTICVEPKTDKDKIDIIWTYADDEIEVCQVKSSIKNFGTNDILRWIEGLRLDNNNAKSYTVILVGNSTHSTKVFFNSISSKVQSDFTGNFNELYNIKDRIKVFFEPNNIETLEEALISGLDKFLFTKEILADYPTKKLIVNGMVNQIIKISTSGKSISKIEFENHLLGWLKFNYSDQISLNKSKFELKFYNGDDIIFLDTISNLTLPDINKSNLFNSKKSEIIELFGKISQFNFNIKTFEKPIDPNDLSSFLRSSIKSPFPYTNEPVIIDSYERHQITKHCQVILSIKPDKEFFNFGGLKESKSKSISFPFTPNKTTLNGKEEEKEKKELYDDFYWKIFELIDLLEYWKKLSKLSILPIVITNSGKTHKENIKVQLFFPKEVKIYKYKNFPIPKTLQVLKNLNTDDSYLFQNIKHKQSSIVNEYYPDHIMPQFINLGMFGSEQKRFEEDKYRSMLDYFFDYTYYYDAPKLTILEFEINELNTNETISLPSYIFINSKTDFTIEYKITCKNDPEPIKGKLNYKASS